MSEGGWLAAAPRDAVEADSVIGVELGGKQIALYDVEGVIYATDNICSHAYALLSDGWLDGDVIECPLHAGRFEVATGKALGAPVTEDLRCYPTRIVDGMIEVKIG